MKDYCSNNKIIKINNDIWLEYFLKIDNFKRLFLNQQLLDLNFLKPEFKKYF
jgi:hypothetical protein